MNYSQVKHFWTWFQKNSDLLLAFPKMNSKEKEYWLREINTHLRAHTKKLFFELLYDNKGTSRFIITTYGNTKYFRMAEAMAAKAPEIPGWEILGLQPPGLIGELLQPMYGHAGIDLQNLKFMPPKKMNDGKVVLDVYAELYGEVTREMDISVEAYMYELLGEKTIGLEISCFSINNLFHLSAEEKSALIPFKELPAHIVCRDTSAICINEKGFLEKRL